MHPDLLHQFDPNSAEKAFPCPRTWEFVSNIVNQRAAIEPSIERAAVPRHRRRSRGRPVFRLPQDLARAPRTRARSSTTPRTPTSPTTKAPLIALCGALYRIANDINFGSIVTYSARLRREIGEFLVGSCIRSQPALQRSDAFIRWAALRTQ